MDIMKKIQDEAFLWGNAVDNAYFTPAESALIYQWENIIYPFLKDFPIDYTVTVDFAAGHGRNAAMLLLKNKIEHCYIVDVNNENIVFCQKRFEMYNNVQCVLCNGLNLDGIDDDSIDFFYSFDAMVHFDIEIIISYVKEIHRVLKPGGYVFLHHSNYTLNPGADFRTNPKWRNFNSKEFMAHIALSNGLNVVNQQVIDWGKISNIDCLSLFLK